MNIGLPQISRDSKEINNFISGFGQNDSKELKYPIDKNIPKEMFVSLSVYDGDLADSIDALLNGVEKVQGDLEQTFGSASGEIKNEEDQTDITKVGDVDYLDAVEGMVSAGGNAFINTINATKYGTSEGLTALSGKNGGWGNAALAKSFKKNIYLPLPNELQEAVAHEYEEQDGWLQDLSSATGGHLTVGATTTAKISATIAKMTGSRHLTEDKNRINMYTGTAFREITMTWTLIPNNQEESKAIHDIVRNLKMYSSPQSTSGKLLLKSPHFFRVKFGNPLIDNAMQFHEVNIINVVVEYSPGGNMEMNADMTPKSVNLSVTFKDREPKLFEDWEKTPSLGGLPQKPSCDSTVTKTENDKTGAKEANKSIDKPENKMKQSSNPKKVFDSDFVDGTIEIV